LGLVCATYVVRFTVTAFAVSAFSTLYTLATNAVRRCSCALNTITRISNYSTTAIFTETARTLLVVPFTDFDTFRILLTGTVIGTFTAFTLRYAIFGAALTKTTFTGPTLSVIGAYTAGFNDRSAYTLVGVANVVGILTAIDETIRAFVNAGDTIRSGAASTTDPTRGALSICAAWLYTVPGRSNLRTG